MKRLVGGKKGTFADGVGADDVLTSFLMTGKKSWSERAICEARVDSGDDVECEGKEASGAAGHVVCLSNYGERCSADADECESSGNREQGIIFSSLHLDHCMCLCVHVVQVCELENVPLFFPLR